MTERQAAVSPSPQEPVHISIRAHAAEGSAAHRLDLAAAALGWQWGYSYLGFGHHMAMAAAITGQPSCQVQAESRIEAYDLLVARLETLVEEERAAAVQG